MRNLNWKMIALGVVVDLGLTMICGGFIGVAATIIEIARGASLDNMESFEKHLMTSPLVLWSSLFVGLMASCAGAFVAASGSHSLKNALQNAGVFGVLTIGMGFLLQLTMQVTYPLWYNVAAYSLIVPTALLGGYFRWRHLEKTNRVLDSATSPIPSIPNS